ncbi:MAG TPA: SDR family oxidoreductase [Dehalococcoidia bacterium]|nr:SDR family oxidoreductase [Dehalococcoidia bacterium]
MAEWKGAKLGLDAFDLTGKHALVVGAENPTGRAIGVALAEAGADVTLVASSPGGEEMFAVKKLARELEALGRRATAVAADVSLGTGAQVMVRQVVKDAGRIDALVNAQDLFFARPADKTSDAEWAKVLAANLSSVFFTARAAGKEMIRQGRGGRIINVTSVLGERATANVAAYAAAHGGVYNLTRALAQEWGPHGITVNCIAKGWMADNPALREDDPEAGKTIRFVPMKRPGLPEDVAPLAVYLASDVSGYISGQVLFVDGGLTTHL